MINEIVETCSTAYEAGEAKHSVIEHKLVNRAQQLPEILFITSFPPRECGIATYSQDLIKAMNKKFDQSFKISICPIESENEQYTYDEDIKYILNKDYPKAFATLAKFINNDENIRVVMIQHEFGLFAESEVELQLFLNVLVKPVVLVFHTVLPHPGEALKREVAHITKASKSVIVMTNTSAKILTTDYGVAQEKITVIPHGTHLVPHTDKEMLKQNYKLEGKKVLSTFGLLGSGKSIETTLNALPAIVEKNPDVLFLIIGKTHPAVVKHEGEKYRRMLEEKVAKLKMQQHVQFVNHFLPLATLLEYLQLTDIYLFTSRDPNQAVSGTFAYAISCGCPIISTPIPHALEVLREDAGIIIDFEDSHQLAEAVLSLLKDEQLRNNISSNGLHTMASTAWENAAIAHALLLEEITGDEILLQYTIPDINLDHVKKLTTDFGMIQFSRINHPDISSGYTLDDNARALIAMCQHYELTAAAGDLEYIHIYFNFIKHCLHDEGFFLNYVDAQHAFTEQNNLTNLADANGRAIWAIGYLISITDLLPDTLTADALGTMRSALLIVNKIHSTRAMAFVIKGLYYSNTKNKSDQNMSLIEHLANRLVQMYRHEADNEWQWYESYLTYANSCIPEALLCAWLATHNEVYKEIARKSFDFLLSKTFTGNRIKVISNKTWMHKGDEDDEAIPGGEQPIDVAYTVIALSKFNDVFNEKKYGDKIGASLNWFLGANHLNQIIYNPCTGGCYDGLEENYVNLNQGAESTVSYLMARLTVEKSLKNSEKMYAGRD